MAVQSLGRLSKDCSRLTAEVRDSNVKGRLKGVELPLGFGSSTTRLRAGCYREGEHAVQPGNVPHKREVEIGQEVHGVLEYLSTQ